MASISVISEDGKCYFALNQKRMRNSAGKVYGHVRAISYGDSDSDIKVIFDGEENLSYNKERFHFDSKDRIAQQLASASNAEDVFNILHGLDESISIQRKPAAAQTKKRRCALADVTNVSLEGVSQLKKIKDSAKGDYIKDKCVGSFLIPVSHISHPPPFYRGREINRDAVDKIKKDCVNICMQPIVTVIPVLVDPDTDASVEEIRARFNELSSEEELQRQQGVPPLYALGGNHVVTAYKELKEELGDNMDNHLLLVDAVVYAELSWEEATTVICGHQLRTERVRPFTFLELVQLLRRLITSRMEPLLTSTPKPSASTVSSRTATLPSVSAEVKKECLRILKKDEEKYQNYLAHFSMASVSQRCNEILKVLMNMKEYRDASQTVFMPFKGLREQEMLELLTKVADGHLTIKAAGQEAMRIKRMQVIRQIFVKETGCKTWQEAVTQYPQYTSDDVLQHFTSNKQLDMRQGQKYATNVPGKLLELIKAAKTLRATPKSIVSPDIGISISCTIDNQVVEDEYVKEIVEKYRKKMKAEIIERKLLKNL